MECSPSHMQPSFGLNCGSVRNQQFACFPLMFCLLRFLPISPFKYLLHAVIMVCVHDPLAQQLEFPAQILVYKAFPDFPRKTQIFTQINGTLLILLEFTLTLRRFINSNVTLFVTSYFILLYDTTLGTKQKFNKCSCEYTEYQWNHSDNNTVVIHKISSESFHLIY